MRECETITSNSDISRRDFTKLLGAEGAVLAAGIGAMRPENRALAADRELERAGALEPIERPNFLVILADDLSWGDLSCYGSPTIRTPNLDQLAADGIRFTDGYAASSVCSPTRISLYTGRYPGRLTAGLREPIVGRNNRDGIPVDHPTLASLLKSRRYDTAMIGKWHCGFLPWFSPTKLGWDEFFGSFGGALDYFSKVDKFGRYDLYEQNVEYQDLRYYTDIIRDRAVAFLERRHTRPWLLNLNFTAPHYPWECCGDREVSDNLTARLLAGDRKALQHRGHGTPEKYAEMVERLDRAVGDVLAAIGSPRKTVVLFSSDNGGERFSDSGPFSGKKLTVLEGGIRVSTLLRWPHTLPGGVVDHTPVTTMDWTATMLELSGAQPDPDYPLDGVSQVGRLLRGETPPARDLFWRLRKGRALRRGTLKYVRLDDGIDRLFDLAADPAETKNLATTRPRDFNTLRQAWAAINATQLPYR